MTGIQVLLRQRFVLQMGAEQPHQRFFPALPLPPQEPTVKKCACSLPPCQYELSTFHKIPTISFESPFASIDKPYSFYASLNQVDSEKLYNKDETQHFHEIGKIIEQVTSALDVPFSFPVNVLFSI